MHFTSVCAVTAVFSTNQESGSSVNQPVVKDESIVDLRLPVIRLDFTPYVAVKSCSGPTSKIVVHSFFITNPAELYYYPVYIYFFIH